MLGRRGCIRYMNFSKVKGGKSSPGGAKAPAPLNEALPMFCNTRALYFVCVVYCMPGWLCVHAVEAARKFNVNAVDCSSVLRVTCPCCCFL